MIRQRGIQVRPSVAGDKRGTAQGQLRAPVEFVKPGSGQQSLPDFDQSGCFLRERAGDLLWAEHVICNPFASDTKGRAAWAEGERRSGSWRNHTTSPPAAVASCLLIHSLGKRVVPNSLLLCQDQAGKEEEGDKGCNSMLTIQEEKLSPGSDDAKQHPDSRLSCRVRTVWRRWLSLWLKRKFTSKTFTNSKESTKKPPGGFWRWLTLRHLLLQAGSGRPHLVASDHLHMCQCAVGSLQPCFMSSPLMLRNRCFLDDGELVVSPRKGRVGGTPFLETKLNPLELPASDTSQRFREGENKDEDRAPGSCHMFRAFQLRLHFVEESDSDLEELLVEDDEDDGEGTDTD